MCKTAYATQRQISVSRQALLGEYSERETLLKVIHAL